jgi:hypothetical protein
MCLLGEPEHGRGREETDMATDRLAPRVRGRRTAGRLGSQLRTLRWTDAHAEAARFVGECVGAGAVLGMVAAMSRSRRGE